jgi:hypothetical protein
MAISPHRSRDPLKDPSDKIVHNASEPSPPTIGAPLPLECKAFKRKTAIPGQTYDRTTGPSIRPQTDFESHAPRDAPEPDSP